MNDDADEPYDLPPYPLSALEPIHGKDLFDITSRLTPNIAYFLPRNVGAAEVANLAMPLDQPERDERGRPREREWVELEEEYKGDKVKAVTAYFGGLVGHAS